MAWTVRLACRGWLAATGVWLIAWGLFALCASAEQFGYEAEQAAQARAYVEGRLTHDQLGRLHPRARGGLVDVAQYVPFVLGARALDAPDSHADIERFWYIWVHPFWTAWTVVALYGLALLIYRCRRAAALTALLAATGTVLMPYSKFGMETQQTLWATASWAAALAYRHQPKPRTAAALAFCLAMLSWTKITGILIVIAVLGVLFWWTRSDPAFRRRFAASAGAPVIGAGVLLGLLVLLLTNRWRYGAYLGARYPWGDRPDAIPLAPERLWALLVSPGKSIFIFSPVLVLTLPWWRRFLERRRELRPVYAALIALVAFHLSMNTWVDERWWFSRLHFAIPLLVLPLGRLAAVYRRGGRCLRLALGLVVTTAFAVQLLGAAVNYTALTYVVHPSRELSLENLVWNPQYNHLRFNLAALVSWWSKTTRGESLPFVVKRRFLPAAPPPGASQWDVFPMKGWDRHDFFLVEATVHPDTPYAATIARTAGGLLVVCLLVGIVCLRRGLAPSLAKISAQPRARVPPSQTRVFRPQPSRKRPWSRKEMVLRMVRGKN